MKVAIVGGGPAGLVAGLAAQRAGIDAAIFEQTRSFRRIGGGILVHSNGLRVLQALDVLDGFEPSIRTTQRLRAELADGRVVGEVDYGALGVPQNRCGVVMRHVLHEYLFDTATRRGVDVRMGHRMTGLVRDGDEVELQFNEGRTFRAGIVVACDGINSATRSAAGIDAHRVAIGEAYLRGGAARAPAEDTIREIWGDDGRRFGICPLPRDRTYIFCSVPIGEWDRIRESGLGEWVDSWAPLGSEAVNLLRAVADWSLASYDELHQVELERWARPPVFIAGDAAHAMTPNLVQGANSAMVDALVLMRILGGAIRGGSPLERVAAQYQSIRKSFVTRIQSASHRMGAIAGLRSPIARGLRNLALRASLQFSAASRGATLLGAGYNPAENQYLEPF